LVQALNQLGGQPRTLKIRKKEQVLFMNARILSSNGSTGNLK